jgi:hypothetical protein
LAVSGEARGRPRRSIASSSNVCIVNIRGIDRCVGIGQLDRSAPANVRLVTVSALGPIVQQGLCLPSWPIQLTPARKDNAHSFAGDRQFRSEKVHAYEHRYSKCGPEGMAQNLAVNRNLCYSFGMVGSQSRFQPGDGERAIQSRFLQPGARMPHPGKGSQEFFRGWPR